MKLVVLYILFVPLVVLGFAGVVGGDDGRASSICEPRPARPDRDRRTRSPRRRTTTVGLRRAHRQHDWYNTTLGVAMLVGRFLLMVPVLAIAGSLGPQAGRAAVGRHASRRTRRCSRRCSSASCSIVVGLTYFPVARARPDRRAPRQSRRPACRLDAPRQYDVRCSTPLLDPAIVRRADVDAFAQARPAPMVRNPVMFVVEVGSVAHDRPLPPRLASATTDENVFAGLVAAWLWFTVLFANFAEAMAEGPRQGAGGHAAQDARGDDRRTSPRRRRRRREVVERSCSSATSRRRQGRRDHPRRRRDHRGHRVASTSRRSPASRRRSSASRAATARRSPAARASCPTRSSCASRAKPGETFLDRMIALVEGADAPEDAERDRAQHPARRPDDHLPARGRDAAAVRDLLGRRAVDDRARRAARVPDPDDDRRAALGDRHRRAWTGSCSATCSRMSGRAVEAAGDCSTLLLDKTGTITLGNRQAARVPPAAGRRREPSWPTPRSSRASPTRRPRGARSSSSPRSGSACASASSPAPTLVPFTAQTRMSGVDMAGRSIRKGAGRRGAALGRATGRHGPAPSSSDRRRDRGVRAARRSSSPRTADVARRHPPQGRRQAGHARALRRAAARWASGR